MVTLLKIMRGKTETEVHVPDILNTWKTLLVSFHSYLQLELSRTSEDCVFGSFFWFSFYLFEELEKCPRSPHFLSNMDWTVFKPLFTTNKIELKVKNGTNLNDSLFLWYFYL